MCLGQWKLAWTTHYKLTANINTYSVYLKSRKRMIPHKSQLLFQILRHVTSPSLTGTHVSTAPVIWPEPSVKMISVSRWIKRRCYVKTPASAVSNPPVPCQGIFTGIFINLLMSITAKVLQCGKSFTFMQIRRDVFCTSVLTCENIRPGNWEIKQALVRGIVYPPPPFSFPQNFLTHPLLKGGGATMMTWDHLIGPERGGGSINFVLVIFKKRTFCNELSYTSIA